MLRPGVNNVPTVTDANLTLGRVSSSIAGGQLTLDAEAAAGAIRETVASPLGMDIATAASGILQIANNAMVGAIRNISVERGYDPRESLRWWPTEGRARCMPSRWPIFWA